MAFPVSAIYDTAVRANELPLNIASNGQAWATISGIGGVGLTQLQILLNKIAGQGASNQYLNVIDAADCEHYGVIDTIGVATNVCDLLIRLKDIGTATTIDCYSVKITFPSTVTINRVDNLATTVLATFTQTVSNGDSLGILMNGSKITAYYKASSGSWTALGNTTDTTYAAGGYKAVTIIGTAPRMSSMGGGSSLNLLTVSGSLSSSGALIKQSSKLAAGAMTSTGLLQKQTSKLLSGSLTSSGVLANIKTAILNVAGTLSSFGTLIKQTNKVYSGTLTSASGLIKQCSKLLKGTLGSSGALANIKTAVLSIGGTLGSSGKLTKQISKLTSGVMASSGGFSKQVSKFFTGILTSIGVLVPVKSGGTVNVAGFDAADTRNLSAVIERPLIGVVYDRRQSALYYADNVIPIVYAAPRTAVIYGELP